MNLIDRTIEIVSPAMALKRQLARQNLKKLKVMNKGYSEHGASKRKKSLQGWITSLGGPQTDIYDNKDTLVARSRDLFMGSPLARGGIERINTNVIGSGLKLKSAINSKVLGLNDVEAEEIETKIEQEFCLWADYNIEQTGLLDFYQVQDLVFLTTMLNGECFIHLSYFETQNTPYSLKLNVIEPDRIATPKDKKSDKTIVNGIKIDKNGRIEGYYILDNHPNDSSVFSLNSNENYKYIPIYGSEGQLNIIHLALLERPNQIRGVPILAPVIESLKQLDRYTDAELMSAVISSMLTVFIESSGPEQGSLGEFGNINEEDRIDTSGDNLELGSGAILELNPGEHVNTVNPARPNSQFEPFMTAIIRQIGSSIGVPYELLIMHFTSSYSASRAALLEAWKTFRKRREWLSRKFCQVVYEEWLRHAFLINRLDLPKYEEDYLIKKAYSNATWNGPSQGQIDPLKEVNAAIKRIDNGLSTRSRETAELNGGDFEQNVRILAKEQKILIEKEVNILNEEKENVLEFDTE
ncbi:phage portal protein [Streptobacillus moniliformis]|uniref:phage portal protein n=1 Tax=Streptobacillus moniliformis TaxID=34105 RepID=UPI0007E36176|nr:phage portal protein [Streptobacillus moniliformis]